MSKLKSKNLIKKKPKIVPPIKKSKVMKASKQKLQIKEKSVKPLAVDPAKMLLS